MRKLNKRIRLNNQGVQAYATCTQGSYAGCSSPTRCDCNSQTNLALHEKLYEGGGWYATIRDGMAR